MAGLQNVRESGVIRLIGSVRLSNFFQSIDHLPVPTIVGSWLDLVGVFQSLYKGQEGRWGGREGGREGEK
jgi:hypothetical protein